MQRMAPRTGRVKEGRKTVRVFSFLDKGRKGGEVREAAKNFAGFKERWKKLINVKLDKKRKSATRRGGRYCRKRSTRRVLDNGSGAADLLLRESRVCAS